jgi:hypothetical protein
MARTQGATRRANITQGQDVPANVQMMVFIQALMERQWMPETEAKQIYRKLSRGGDGRLFQVRLWFHLIGVRHQVMHPYAIVGWIDADVAYSQLIAEANHSMEAMKFRIKRVRYPVTTTFHLCLL